MTSSQMKSLQAEFEFFNRIKSQLSHDYPSGGHVVIKDQTVLGVWESRNMALEQGLREFGNVVFLVRNLEDEPAHHVNFSFSSNL